MRQINTKIFFLIMIFFLFSCKEKKRQTENFIVKDTIIAIKDNIEKRILETQNKQICNKKEWIKNYINDLGVSVLNTNDENITNRNFIKLLLDNQKFYLGYIGPNKRRLDIKFTTIDNNHLNSFKYNVNGYTIVNNNKRYFKGFIEITDINKFKDFLYGVDDIMKGEIKEQGIIAANYLLKENPKKTATGIFQGKCIIKWYIDNNDKLRYDDIEIDSDSYSNNQFIGTWKSYRTDKIKICAWGQFRIPCAGDLDIGAGEFYPNKKYSKFGWSDYTP